MARASKHTEKYRVVTDKYWPRTPDGAHNTRYFDYYDDALIAYMHSTMNQLFEKVLVERVALECRCAENGTYAPMFESYQLHTLESYGLCDGSRGYTERTDRDIERLTKE